VRKVSSLTLRLFLALLTLASLCHVGVLFPRFIAISRLVPDEARSLVWGILITVLTAVGGCALALVLVVRSWENRGARSLALFLAFLAAVWGTLLRFIQVEVLEGSVSATVQVGGWDGTMVVGGLLLATAAFIRFSTLFPSPHSPDGLPPPGRLPALRSVRALLFRPAVVWGLAAVLILLHGVLAVLSRAWLPSAATGEAVRIRGAVIPLLLGEVAIIGVAPLLGIGLGIRNLAWGYRLASGTDRKRVLWLVAGVSAAGWMILASVLGTSLVVILGLPDWLGDVCVALFVFAPSVLVVTCAVALFYAGSVDPGLVLKRSTVYGALGAMGILLFAGLEEVFSDQVALQLGLPGMVGSLLAGSLTAGVMIPLRKAVARMATRVLPGQERRAKES